MLNFVLQLSRTLGSLSHRSRHSSADCNYNIGVPAKQHTYTRRPSGPCAMLFTYTDRWAMQFVTAGAFVFHGATNTEIRSDEVSTTD